MRKCPHCDTPVPSSQSRCPRCGQIYWEPGKYHIPEERKELPGESEREGCGTLIIWPLLISLAVTAVLILIGFSTHFFWRWEDYSFPTFWILLSILFGAAVFKRLFKNQEKRTSEEAEKTQNNNPKEDS